MRSARSLRGSNSLHCRGRLINRLMGGLPPIAVWALVVVFVDIQARRALRRANWEA